MRFRFIRHLPLLTLVFISVLYYGCAKQGSSSGLSDLNRDLELEIRLTAADFSIVDSVSTVVAESFDLLSRDYEIPDELELEFAGKDIDLPGISTDNAVGLGFTNGRSVTVYLFDPPHRPAYGEINPLALAHYIIPAVDLDIVLVLVCFQYDTEGSNIGIGVRSVNLDGIETSAPFAVALKHEELTGKFFYDEFISGDKPQVVAGRSDWDQGFLLLTRLGKDTVLSTYVPLY